MEHSETSTPPPAAPSPLKGEHDVTESDAETETADSADASSTETDSSAGDSWISDGENAEGVAGWSSVGMVFATALVEVAQSTQDDDHDDDEFPVQFPYLTRPVAQRIHVARWGAIGERLSRMFGTLRAEDLEKNTHIKISLCSS